MARHYLPRLVSKMRQDARTNQHSFSGDDHKCFTGDQFQCHQ
ncbi:unnamed protein product [Periconia digitata]|uniref:Uncharacterized protein n=1 Tax=Periconia digitata TaxID=1303443 RepID=A0A9W4URN7_9PLEO|nr:unnamed protein product [Periconia digitata]